MNTEEIRLNKFIAEAGLCSRREADRLIEAGRVTVDGQTAVTGMKVTPASKIVVDGKPTRSEEEKIFLAFNKPAGLICTTEIREGTENIYQYLRYPKRIFSIGRLDKDSEGLLLLTNDGGIVNKIARSVNGHEKEYIVTVNKEITDEFLAAMAAGVTLSEIDATTRPCEIHKEGRRTFRIILTQGLNRQIRRMCAELGYRVRKLVRVRIMNIRLGGLAIGAYRNLTEEELRELTRLTADSRVSYSPAEDKTTPEGE